MAAKILFGFGGVKFFKNIHGQDYTATFPGGHGKIIYTPIQLIHDTVDHGIASRLLGWRVTIDISELYNVDSDDYLEYQTLANMLSDLVDSTTQKTVTITPRDDSTITNDLTYECILTSSFSPSDIHRLKTGQNLALKFTCINKLTSIPTTVSDTTTNIYWDGTDEYWDGTDKYIDELG